MLVACVIAPVFNLLTSAASLHEAIQGLVDAVIISLAVGGYLLYVRDGWLRLWFRRIGFWRELALSSTIVLALFLLGRAAGQVVTTGQPRRFLASFARRPLDVRRAVLRRVRGDDAVRPADEPHARHQRAGLLCGRHLPPAQGRRARLSLRRPGGLHSARRAAGQRPVLRAAASLRRRPVGSGDRIRRRDLPVRRRRGRDHLAAGGRGARSQLHHLLLRDPRGRGASRHPLRARVRRGAAVSAAGSTAARSRPASWATSGSRSSSSATSSTRPRGWRNTPSGASSTSSSPERCWSA